MNDENIESLLAEPLQTEALAAFGAEDMLICGSCSRKSPPDRAKCIYCGGELEMNIERVRLLHRKLEVWEKGWNIVLRPVNECPERPVISRLAADLALDEEYAKRALGQRLPIPIARVEDEKEAKLWLEKLRTLGLESMIISDEQLNADTRPQRLREIRFLENGLEFIDFNTLRVTSVKPEMIRVVVTGPIFTDMSEKLEKRKGSKSGAVEEFESSNDEPIIDMYIDDGIGHRVHSSGFDFSCLGSSKANIAGENCERLVERILSVSPSAKLVDTYRGVRSLLTEIWGVDQGTEFGGRRRSGLMGSESRKKTTRTNLTQFTKFSRLQSLIG